MQTMTVESLFQATLPVATAKADSGRSNGSGGMLARPQDLPLRGTIANDPAAFVAHGVSVNDLGSYPGGARASQIVPDLTGPQLASPARARDGYELRGPGTPEAMMGQSRQGAILDRVNHYGVVHLGVGPGIPILLLALIGLAFVWTQTRIGR